MSCARLEPSRSAAATHVQPPSLCHFETQALLPSASVKKSTGHTHTHTHTTAEHTTAEQKLCLCGGAGMWLLPARVWLGEDF